MFKLLHYLFIQLKKYLPATNKSISKLKLYLFIYDELPHQLQLANLSIKYGGFQT